MVETYGVRRSRRSYMYGVFRQETIVILFNQ